MSWPCLKQNCACLPWGASLREGSHVVRVLVLQWRACLACAAEAMTERERSPVRAEAPTRPGPVSWEEMCFWARDHIGQLLDSPDHRAHLREIMNCKIRLTTDYSGKGCAEMAMHLIAEACSFHNIESKVCCHRATELDENCRKVLASMTEPPTHIMGDICERALILVVALCLSLCLDRLSSE